MTEHPNKRAKTTGSVYQRASDGAWCASLELPSPDGSRRRVVRVAKTEKLVMAKLKLLRDDLERRGDIPTSGQTLAVWLNYWYANIAVKEIRPKTAANYRSTLNNHIIPSIGRTRLDKLTPASVRKLHDDITGKGLSTTTALLAHNILASALKYALREGRVAVNVTSLTNAPRRARQKLNVMSTADAIQVMRTVLLPPDKATPADRLGSRWTAALLTGARQGELLGLELDRVVNVTNNQGQIVQVLDMSWQLQRLTWMHGCAPDGIGAPAATCGKKRGTDCPSRKLDSPADWEHRHVTGGLWLSRPKSDAGWRIIPLVEPLRTLIMQRVETAATEPNPHGLVWTADPKMDRHGRALPLDGSPIDPSWDSAAWDAVLKRAGVGDVRLHDARHVTASLLLKAKVPMDVRKRIMGHSSAAMVEHYTDIDEEQTTSAMLGISALLTII